MKISEKQLAVLPPPAREAFLVALIPQHPDPRTNAAHQSWRADAARHFLLLGGIEPDRATVVASTLRCPHPLAWSWSGSSSYPPKPFTGG